MGYGQSATDQTPLSPTQTIQFVPPDLGRLRELVKRLQATSVQPVVADNVKWPNLYELQLAQSRWAEQALLAIADAEGVPASPGTPARGVAALRVAAEVNDAWSEPLAIATSHLWSAVQGVEKMLGMIDRIRRSNEIRQYGNWQQVTNYDEIDEERIPLSKWLAPLSALPSRLRNDEGKLEVGAYPVPLTAPAIPGRATAKRTYGPFAVVITYDSVEGQGVAYTAPNFGYWLAFIESADDIAGHLHLVESQVVLLPHTTVTPPTIPAGNGTPAPGTPTPEPPAPGTPIPTQPPPPGAKLPPGTTPGTPVAASGKGISAVFLVGAVGATVLGIWSYKNRNRFP
ncbi:MAG: hypothetical protein ACYTGE_11280 [Planctomycetota bacterium]